MEHSMYKLGRAASISAGLLLGLVTAGCASRHAHQNDDAAADAGLYDTSRIEDQSTTYGGTGMGGTGSDSGMGGMDSTYRDTGTGVAPYPGVGGSGDTGMGTDSGMGTGGSIDTGTGGSGMDTLRMPSDSTRPIDSLGVPDWEERG